MADVLVLGGTAWLGREVARQAVAAGDRVTCLARGESGHPADGVRWVRGDRSAPDAYDDLLDRDWDLVIDVSRQPGHVRTALDALADRSARWVFVSTINVYDDPAEGERWARNETDRRVTPLEGDVADLASYGAGKVACEQAVAERLGDRAVSARVGLIGGAGDRSGRSSYWPRRFRAAGSGPVLVPAVPDAPVQLIDAVDLAAWLLRIGRYPDATGAFDVAGPIIRFEDWIALCRDRAGHRGVIVEVDPAWLAEQEVGHWMGPRSLPLWLPAEAEPMMRRDCERARSYGLTTRPAETMVDEILAADGDDTPTGAGLTRTDELELIERWRARS